MKIIGRLFPGHAELEALKAERDGLIERVEFLQQEKADSIRREANARQKAGDLQTELDRLSKKLREQTDADLLLVSQRITAKILEGDKPEPREIAEQKRLMAQRQALGMANTHYSGYNGDLGAILGGSAFGLR